LPFGSHTNICIAPKVVYWQAKVRPLTLLFAASAAARVQSSHAQRKEIEEELSHDREAVESYRLCDTNKSRGYVDAGFCNQGELKHGSVDPKAACVNLD
jgi:hypothetical protein